MSGASEGASASAVAGLNGEGGRALTVLALLAAVSAVSTAAIAIRQADAWAASWIGAGRVATTAVVLAPFAWTQLRATARALVASPALMRRVLLSSLFLAAHFACWIASLSMTSVVTSVALVATQPLFAGFLGRWLGDAVPRRVYAGAVVAMGGGAIMSGELGSYCGAALALAGAAFGAAYLAVGRSVRKELPLSGYFVSVHAMGAIMLAAFAVLSGAELPTLAGESWAFVLYLGLVPGVVGHGLMNWAVRRVPLHFVALLILAEPIGSGVLAWIWLNEIPALGELVGGGVLLLGIAIGAWPVSTTGRGGEPSQSSQ